jgi:uncharacterized membrane protein required for colicin V production
MTSTIAFLIVLLLLVLMTYAGLRDGAFFTTYALVRNALAFVCAMTFCQPLARVLERLVTQTYPARVFFVPLSFGAVFGAIIALGRWLKVTYTIPRVECPVMVDRVAGPILGLLNGVIATGTLLVLWSLLPFARYIPADYGNIQVRTDTGAAALRFYAFVQKKVPGSAVFLLADEPVQEDQNNNGRADPGDKFLDENRNDKWDHGWLWKYRNYAWILPDDIGQLNLPTAAPRGTP